MSIIRRFKYLIVLILIPFILTIIWFRNGLIIGGGEEGLIFYNPQRALEISKSVWVEYGTGAPVLAWLARTSFLIPSSILVNKISLPPFLVQAGLFFTLMLVGVVSIYYLTLNLLENHPSRFLVSFITAIFYLLNPFSMSQIWGRGIYPLFFSFSLLPLSLLLVLKGLKNKQFIYMLPLVLSSVIFSNAFGVVTFLITYWVVLFLFFFWWLFINNFSRDKVLFGLSFMNLLFIGWIAVSSWWLLPLVVEGNKIFIGYLTNDAENLGTLLGVSRNFTPDIIIRLLQRTYYYDASAFSPIYVSWFFQLISWLPVVFVLYSLYRIFKHQLVQFRFFAVLLILGLIVSLGANPPFGWLFVWIFKQVSILQAFRNPFEKFGLVYALGYCAIFAFGLVSFFENKRFKNFGILIVLLITCGIFAWPMWTGRVVAGPDKKIGIDVPDYYQKLNNWLKNQDMDEYRIMMTPIWSGDGAFYKWNDTRYQGADHMMHILDYSTISSGSQIPFYYQFIQSIRKNMERMDTSPSLALFRTKVLVDRKDAISITEDEKKHYQFLTSAIFPPSDDQTQLKSICQNKRADSKANGLASIVCQINNEGDWKDIRYLHLKIMVSEPSTLDLAVRDRNEIRIRWYGKLDPEYTLKAGEWNYITIPLHAPSEYNSNIDFSKIYLLEVMAYQLDNPERSVDEIILEDIKLDPGSKVQVSSFENVANFGKLEVFKFRDTNFAPEFGILSSVDTAKDFPELFNMVKNKKKSFDKVGFIVDMQNPNKDMKKLSEEFIRQLLEREKISNTRYWMKLDDRGANGLIILSKTFNSRWKMVPGVNKADIAGGFINDLRLLQKSVLSEDNHFVVNGYANLWKVDGEDREYAIVFMPQIVADIGWKISVWSVIILFGGTIIWGVKKYTSLH